jgi:TrpR-related protein YerC/YecD
MERKVQKTLPGVQPTRDSKLLAQDLCRALLTPRSVEEMSRLLADLCTPAEVRTLAERWHVAQLLERGGLSYRDIHDATGVSTTTIVRVARFLKQEPYQAYRQAMQRIGERDDD